MTLGRHSSRVPEWRCAWTRRERLTVILADLKVQCHSSDPQLVIKRVKPCRSIRDRPERVIIRSRTRWRARGLRRHWKDCGVWLLPLIKRCSCSILLTTKSSGLGMGLSICRFSIMNFTGAGALGCRPNYSRCEYPVSPGRAYKARRLS